MPDRQDDLNPASDLAPFADALRRLAPQPAHLSRDALLFEAGKAAATRLPAWVWPSVAGGFAALSVVLAAFLMSADPPAAPEVRYVYGAPSPPMPEADAVPKPEPAAKPRPLKSSEDLSETARLLRQRQDVLRWGIDMLPESKPAAKGPSADMTAREVTHWLGLPPGTFAVNPALPKKPDPKNEDDE
jgi:hypothetical protein